MHRGKQVWLRLSKDLPRVRRLLVVDGAMDAATLSAVKDGDDTLMLAQAAPGLRQSLEQTAWRRAPGDAADPATTVWLIDPHGNLMMRYSLDYDPHGLLRDLQHLLKISISG
ncbi:hypothetical protein [Methylogaea oryzae]|uniref:hypothetical protein n=1 Tax=Methylogaea oryzae TaxID=1295382 RepID=UPI0006D0D2D4|nr:hypothetical protein [Methylogaea oryzae]